MSDIINDAENSILNFLHANDIFIWDRLHMDKSRYYRRIWLPTLRTTYVRLSEDTAYY